MTVTPTYGCLFIPVLFTNDIQARPTPGLTPEGFFTVTDRQFVPRNYKVGIVRYTSATVTVSLLCGLRKGDS